MHQETAEARGRVTLRPWRVGLLVDTTSAAEVREAIAQLSSVWGGSYMPIFDVNAPVDELERLAQQYDVDSLYVDLTEGPVADLIRKPGYSWAGRGRWGPFGEEDRFRKGLLPIRALIDTSTELIQLTWANDHPADLALAALWGLADRLGAPPTALPDTIDLRSLSIHPLLENARISRPFLGALEATAAHLEVQSRAYLDGYSGIYLMRPNYPQDIVAFWNMRIYGTRIIGLPADGADDIVALLLSEQLPHNEIRRNNGAGPPEQIITVWGLEDASTTTAGAITAAASRDGLITWPEARDSAHFHRYIFQGLRTTYTRTVRVDFRPEARWVDVPLPTLALVDDPGAIARGVVAAEVEWDSVVGQDPRMTGALPPYPQEASLLRHVTAAAGVDHVRVTYDGLAFGLDARRDYLRVPFVFNEDAIRLLFDDEAVTVAQSDAGRFQTRAAQKFGGPFTGLFNQPGVRAAMTLAAGERSGVTIPHLRNVVEHNQGEWPDPLFGPRLAPKDYAKQEIDHLLHSGIFVPTLRVHCSFCRVENYVAADDLATTMTCEFCGQPFNLALSHSLTLPKWHYRLAAHLGSDKVQALLPVLATASFLRQLRHIEEPPLTHVFGLEVAIEKRKVEVDLAAYIPDHDWTVVLAEVKSGNRIDNRDVTGLELLRQKLADAGVRSVLLFVTLKDHFSPEEVTELRALADRSPVTQQARGHSLVANLPLVLTGHDLSHPPGSDKHPWQWEERISSGLLGMALTSCRRNLGLKDYQYDHAANAERIICEWSS